MNLEKLLREHKMSQSELARRLGVSRTSVNYWVKGICNPIYDMLPKMCEIFNCSYEELMGEHSPTRIKIDKKLDKMNEDQLKEILRMINGSQV